MDKLIEYLYLGQTTVKAPVKNALEELCTTLNLDIKLPVIEHISDSSDDEVPPPQKKIMRLNPAAKAKSGSKKGLSDDQRDELVAKAEKSQPSIKMDRCEDDMRQDTQKYLKKARLNSGSDSATPAEKKPSSRKRLARISTDSDSVPNSKKPKKADATDKDRTKVTIPLKNCEKEKEVRKSIESSDAAATNVKKKAIVSSDSSSSGDSSSEDIDNLVDKSKTIGEKSAKSKPTALSNKNQPQKPPSKHDSTSGSTSSSSSESDVEKPKQKLFKNPMKKDETKNAADKKPPVTIVMKKAIETVKLEPGGFEETPTAKPKPKIGPASSKKPGPASSKKPGPASSKKPGPASSKKPGPASKVPKPVSPDKLYPCDKCYTILVSQEALDEHKLKHGSSTDDSSAEDQPKAKPGPKSKKLSSTIKEERQKREEKLHSDDEKMKKPGPKSSKTKAGPASKTKATPGPQKNLKDLLDSSSDEEDSKTPTNRTKKPPKIRISLGSSSKAGPPKPTPSKAAATASSGGWKCAFCTEIHLKRGNLKNHTLNHFKNDLLAELPSSAPFTCPKCPSGSRDKITLMRHYAFSHKVIYKYCSPDDLNGIPISQPEALDSKKTPQPKPTPTSGASKPSSKSKEIISSSTSDTEDDDKKPPKTETKATNGSEEKGPATPVLKSGKNKLFSSDSDDEISTIKKHATKSFDELFAADLNDESKTPGKG